MLSYFRQYSDYNIEGKKFYLFRRDTELRKGSVRAIYFFRSKRSKARPGDVRVTSFPEGYTLEHNMDGTLMYLKKVEVAK